MENMTFVEIWKKGRERVLRCPEGNCGNGSKQGSSSPDYDLHNGRFRMTAPEFTNQSNIQKMRQANCMTPNEMQWEIYNPTDKVFLPKGFKPWI